MWILISAFVLRRREAGAKKGANFGICLRTCFLPKHIEIPAVHRTGQCQQAWFISRSNSVPCFISHLPNLAKRMKTVATFDCSSTPSGILRDPLCFSRMTFDSSCLFEILGILCDSPRLSGVPWDSLTFLEILSAPLPFFEILLGFFEFFEILWDSLNFFEIIWDSLRFFEIHRIFWDSLRFSDFF